MKIMYLKFIQNRQTLESFLIKSFKNIFKNYLNNININ